MANPVDEQERGRIVAMLERGESLGAVSKATGRSKDTISRIGRVAGIQTDVRRAKRAEAARKDYAQAERLELLNEGFAKARALLSGCSEMRDLQAWTVAVGTLIDKRRLEDGEATNRTENVDPSRRERIKAGFDELARKRQRLG